MIWPSFGHPESASGNPDNPKNPLRTFPQPNARSPFAIPMQLHSLKKSDFAPVQMLLEARFHARLFRRLGSESGGVLPSGEQQACSFVDFSHVQALSG